MILFEQRLQEEMLLLIPSTFPEEIHAEMIKAAETWRLPYWDWAMKKPNWNPENQDDPVNRIPGSGPNVPFLITQKMVEVRTQTGSTSVQNPWYQFSVAEGRTFGTYGVEHEERPWVSSIAGTAICTNHISMPYVRKHPDDPRWTKASGIRSLML